MTGAAQRSSASETPTHAELDRGWVPGLHTRCLHNGSTEKHARQAPRCSGNLLNLVRMGMRQVRRAVEERTLTCRTLNWLKDALQTPGVQRDQAGSPP